MYAYMYVYENLDGPLTYLMIDTLHVVIWLKCKSETTYDLFMVAEPWSNFGSA